MKKDKVIDYVDSNYVLSLTQQLISIPSESGCHERSKDRTPLVTLLNEQFMAMGLETQLITLVEGSPNIYAKFKGSGEGPKLILRAHAGTIEVTEMQMGVWSSDPFAPYIKDGKLYGVGSGDDKGGVATAIGAVKAIVQSGIRFNGEISVIITTAGEGEPGGYRELFQENLFPKADAAIIIDASDRKIVRQYKGRIWFEFVVHGKSVHACEPEAGINAIDKMYEVIQALKKIRFTDRDDPALGKVTFAVTSIDAINVISSVPEKCKMTADLGMIPGLTSEEAIEKIQALLNKLMHEDKELNVVMNVVPNSVKEACEVPLDHPIVQATAQAMKKIVGQVEYTPGIMSGGGYWHLKYGIPAVFFGPGSILNAHIPNEYVDVSRLGEATKIVALAALNFLGVPD